MKIILATGGTAGHVFPALLVARRLASLGHEAIFVGALSKSLERIRGNGYEVVNLDARGLTFQSAGGIFLSGALMARALVRSLKILRKLAPDAVCGFGGYGAFAVGIAAVILRIPTMIHEQNVVPGRANKLLAGLVRKVAVSFRKTEKSFEPSKTVWTGCPCRDLNVAASRETLLREFGLSVGKFTILALGGSQGSYRINESLIGAAQLLKNNLDFQIIHLAGVNDVDSVAECYKGVRIPFRAFGFLEEMEKAYAVADVVVGRSGAMTVTEIAHSHLPAVLIPYPYAGGHQKANARILEDLGGARVLEEKDLTPQSLNEAILSWNKNPLDKRSLETRLPQEFVADSTGRLTEEILRLKS